MKRDIYKQLESWKNSHRRKPLILDGARQVGKTFALKYFAKKFYEKVVYLNFEKDERLADFFKDSLDPSTIIKTLSLYTDIEIEPENTLLIFDEVQECPRALNSLKYFCEDANEYHLAAAGSLLGVKTAHQKGFPVGKVNFLHLFPLNFFEFLSATKNEKLRTFLEEIKTFDPLPEPIHKKLISLLKEYFFTGGMPEVVADYAQNGNFSQAREIQLEILSAYERDFAKHAPDHQVMKINTVWKQIHQQLAKENKKFIFASIRKSARAREYEEAIQWLKEAGLIYTSYNVETPKLPLSGYRNNHIFKLFLIDIGLLGAQSNLSPKTIIEGNHLFTEFKGALTENYISQELICSLQQKNLHYWTSPGSAEVDFLIENDQEIYPLEVKAGNSHKKKSLLVYGEKYETEFLSRATLLNLKKNGKIHNYPLYLISRFPFYTKTT